METERIANCDIICGVNGTGKTTLLKRLLIRYYEAGNRILIVTPHPNEWSNVPDVHPTLRHHIATYTGWRRILYYDGCVDDIRQYYSNGVLVFDDARAYIHAQTNDFMTWLQISRRQKSIDFISVFHGLTQVPPQYFTFASNLFLFYTKDNIKRRGVYVDEIDFVRIQEAKRRIAQKVADGDKYYFELINLDARI